MKVSVIIPVYNGERYLRECLDSVVAQTYQDYEIIIIDDGSKDASGRIADEYASGYKNIRVQHKENAGLICARIDGISMAKGEFIAFVDADDWVDEDFLEMLVQNMEESSADIVTSGCIREKAGVSTKELDALEEGIYYDDKLAKVYERMLCHDTFFKFGILPYLCTKMFRTEKLKMCYEDIERSIYDGEDVAVTFPYILDCDTMVVLQEAKYHYRIHSAATTAKKKDDYYDNVSKLYLYLNRKFKETKYYAVLLPQLDQYMRMMIRNGNVDAFIESEKKIFPFAKVPKGAKILLYGAGHVGKIYYYQIQQTGYCKVAAWVDKGKAGSFVYDKKIDSLKKPEEEMFDYVVIAIADIDVAEEIKHMLLNWGIKEEVIIY